jgi:ParB-like chromosome segregation protein Spo0J
MPAGRPTKRDPAHNVELRAIETLIPYARNSRTHSPEQVAQIAASITEWGWTTPVLIDEAGMIIAGHGRVLAARKLGLTDVPVVVATDWSDTQKRAYVIADNKLALNAGWDNELLTVELADLRDTGFDVDLTGFGIGELTAMFEEPNFDPGTEDEQGKLDQLAPKIVQCPHCGQEYDAREHG